MVAKNNKRKQETEEKIKKAYLKMLEGKETPNIRAICRMVNINKSTFYRHYEYLGDLEKDIKKEMAKRLFDDLVNGTLSMTIDEEYLTRGLEWMNHLSKGERMIISSRDQVLFDEYSKCCYEYFKLYIKDPVAMVYTICTSYLAIRIFAGSGLSDQGKIKFGAGMMKIFIQGFDHYQEEVSKNYPDGFTLSDFTPRSKEDLKIITDILVRQQNLLLWMGLL